MKISPFLEFASVGLGGAIGAIGRWSLAEAVAVKPHGFPVATLAVNVIGCACIGLAARRIGAHRRKRQRLVWWFSVTGVLGGFTTFSSFAVETERLGADGSIAIATLYVVVTVLAGVAAVAWTAGPPPIIGAPD